MARKPLVDLNLNLNSCLCNEALLRKRHYNKYTSDSKNEDKIFVNENSINNHAIHCHSNSIPAFISAEISSPPNKCRKTCFVIRRTEMKRFFSLLDDDPVIQDFLNRETCYKISDKYLLAMVFAYFKRAEFSLHEYSRINFFTALYLANDIEEDEEDLKYEIFPWALGCQWQRKYCAFLKMKDYLWKKMGYRAVVSRKCCDELMAIEPDHSLWSRNRPDYHSGAIRNYHRSEEYKPRGPFRSPHYCARCEDHRYNSLDNTSWFLSSNDSDSSGDVDIENVLPTTKENQVRKGIGEVLHPAKIYVRMSWNVTMRY